MVSVETTNEDLCACIPPLPPRYAVKLMYDEGSLGEVESLTELSTYLEEYENEWCIASENEKDWKSAILSKCPHLFSVDHDPETVCVICIR